VPIQIDFLANVSKFLRGSKDVEDALEDVSDSLDDVARDSQKEADKMADGFVDAGKDIDRSNERLERSFADLADAAKSETQKGSREMSRNFEQGTSAAKRDLKELGNEARQNAAETFSSFDGSAESFADGIQGTLGGIVSSLGPVGAAAGAAAAIGIGLATAGIAKSKEETEELKERIADLTKQYIEAGGVGKRSFEDVVDDIKDLATETDDSVTNLEDLKRIAERLKTPLSDVTKAYLEGGSALDDLIAQTERLQRKEQERYEASVEAGDSPYGGLIDGGITYEKNLNDQLDVLREQKGAIEEAQEAQLNYLEAGATEFEAKVGLINSINKAYDEAATATDEYINAESGIFDVTAYLEAMAAKTQALKDYQENLAAADLSPAAREYLNSLGVDAAASILSGYQAAAPDQKRQLNEIWTEYASDNSGTYKTNLQTGLSSTTIKGPRIIPDKPDAGAIARDLQREMNGRTIYVDYAPRPGQRNP